MHAGVWEQLYLFWHNSRISFRSSCYYRMKTYGDSCYQATTFFFFFNSLRKFSHLSKIIFFVTITYFLRWTFYWNMYRKLYKSLITILFSQNENFTKCKQYPRSPLVLLSHPNTTIVAFPHHSLPPVTILTFNCMN